MRIAVCDDEKEMRDMLVEKVRRLYPSWQINGYSSGEEVLAEQEQADILFLDIQMPGMNGMETARALRKRDRKMILIFVTAIEEYVFQAFDVGAFHYLVKPFTDEKFAQVLETAAEQYQEMKALEKRAENQEEEIDRYLLIKSGGTHRKVRISEIIYAEVFNRKIILHKTDGDVTYYGKMSELEEKAGGDFYRSHRAYLVHFKYVERYDASTIYLERGSALMAKKNYPEFVKKYLKYNQRKGNEG